MRHDNRLDGRRLQGRTGQRRHLAGHAIDRQAMAQIGGQLEGEQLVVEVHDVAQVGPQRRVGAQLEQTAMVG